MEHLDFMLFSDPVNKQFQKLAADKNLILARTSISGDELYEQYLNAYPKSINSLFRERNHYDGNYDKNYIRKLGNVVSIDSEGNLDSIWNVKVPDYFQQVADTMHQIVISKKLDTIFLCAESTAGSKPNKDNKTDIIWSHFYSVIPSSYVIKEKENTISQSIGAITGQFNNNLGVFKRGLNEFTVHALETVLELIEANSLYRGAENKKAVQDFLNLKKRFDSISKSKQEAFTHYTTKKLGGIVCFKNTSIGTLVEDLSNSVELEKAVASFETKVAPLNYKRTTALATPQMYEQAKQTIEKLGCMPAFDRRLATLEDIDINHTCFVSQNDKALSVFDDLKEDALKVVKPESLSKIEEISLDHFLQNVLPSASQIEVLFSNKHTSNLMTMLTSVDVNAPHIFKWNNNFSWSYNGNVTDSIKERVKQAGGDVNGYARISLSWFNSDDLDLACIYNKHNSKQSPERIYFGQKSGQRTLGRLDVDMNSGYSGRIVDNPVENLTWKNPSNLSPGTYKIIVDQFNKRNVKNNGFSLQTEFDGLITTYHYEQSFALRNFEACSFVVNESNQVVDFKIHNTLKTDSSVPVLHSEKVWSLDTNTWVKVNTILLSPNTWDTTYTKGNEHIFFIIDACRTDQPTRSFYNEFLRDEFIPHRKAFELLGEKLKVQPSPNQQQASGLGFSSTRREKVTVRVTGKTKRTFVINL